MTNTAPPRVVQVDIISDVVCPWCVVGFRQLSDALKQTGMKAALRWHPFELNPDMAAKGEILREHLMAKYGISKEQSVDARQRLTDLGASLGFAFNFSEEMRMVNTFQAHQLLDWAFEKGLQTQLKQILFVEYFSKGKDVSDPEVLIAAAKEAGLDVDETREVLNSGRFADEIRKKQAFWQKQGVTGVPAMIFDKQYLVSGAQGAAQYAEILQKVASGKVEV